MPSSIFISVSIVFIRWLELTVQKTKGLGAMVLSHHHRVLSLFNEGRLPTLLSVRILAWERPNRIPLCSRELSLVDDWEFLYPAVIHVGNRQYSLTTMTFVPDDFIVLRNVVVRQHHCTGNHCIIYIAVVVRIIVQHNQTVGELAGDIGIVSATFFRAEVHP